MVADVLQRNFELPRVKSINTSGHKYGLVYAGVGWIIWRDEAYLPEHLIFELDYLGGTEKSFTLNFSRPGAHVMAQYFNLIHLGFKGYREVMENCLANTRLLSNSLEATGWYTCVSEIHKRRTGGSSSSSSAAASVVQNAKRAVTGGGRGEVPTTSAGFEAGLPVVAFRLSDEFGREFPHVRQESVALLLRARGWIVPNYALPPGEAATEILRVVVRESLSLDLLDKFIADIVAATQTLIDEDAVDLSVLKKQAIGATRRHAPKEKVAEAARRGGKMLEDGIHRTVC